MATMTIEIPDHLYEQMSSTDRNWPEVCRSAIEAGLRQAVQPSVQPWIDTATLLPDTVIKPFGVPDEVMIHPRSLTDGLSAWLKTIDATIPVANQNYSPAELLDHKILTKTLEPGSHWKLCLYTTKVTSFVKYINMIDFSLGLWFIYGNKDKIDANLKTEIPILKVRFLANQTYEVLELAGLRQPAQEHKPMYSYDDESIYFRVIVPDSDEELVFTGQPKSVDRLSGRVISTGGEEDQWLGVRAC